ncbi:MAG TPA: hypothetical protein VLF63_02200 [Patescibacteria group bacterium]|nr:hypothetical protein [Patescibacteria group bacterium]
MTQPEIRTQIKEGRGVIEMRPQLDDESWEVIHNLGIEGISQIVEREGPEGDSLQLTFDHANQRNLERNAQSIAEALANAISISIPIEVTTQ